MRHKCVLGSWHPLMQYAVIYFNQGNLLAVLRSPFAESTSSSSADLRSSNSMRTCPHITHLLCLLLLTLSAVVCSSAAHAPGRPPGTRFPWADVDDLGIPSSGSWSRAWGWVLASSSWFRNTLMSRVNKV